MDAGSSGNIPDRSSLPVCNGHPLMVRVLAS